MDSEQPTSKKLSPYYDMVYDNMQYIILILILIYIIYSYYAPVSKFKASKSKSKKSHDDDDDNDSIEDRIEDLNDTQEENLDE